ncbi:MAG: aldo/keto reductase [Bacteroidia bacterium]|nr:aldo/keto reductase [Bacteroidia bacterium]
MENNNRRQFLKKSIIGLSGAVLLPANLNIGTSKAGPPELPFRTLGKTGIKTPLISMGTSGATASGFIRAGYEAGIKLFFSATYYGEGNNEKLVGEGLKGLPRDSFVVGTAVPPDGLDMRTGKFLNGFDQQAYMKKAEESLKRFGIDYVDFFLFPFAGKREMVLNEGVLKALELLKKQGKTRFVGIASHGDTEEALQAAVDSGIYELAMIAYNYKTINKDKLHVAIEKASKAGIGIVAMKTTAGASEVKSGPPINTDAALKWVLQNNNISSIVSGMSSFEELQKNLAMIQTLKMSEKELKDLSLTAPVSESGLFCQQCKQCIPQCPHNLDIPTIMRSYMYAYGYKNTSQAWHTLADVNLSGNTCGNCTTCNVKCISGFNIKNKIMDIVRLKEVPRDFLHA